MTWRHRITFLVLGVFASMLGACKDKKDVERAKRSVYDTDFAVVYSAVLDATRDLYPNLDDNPGAGRVKTAWHQVSYGNNQDDLANQRTIAQGQGVVGGPNSAAAMQAGVPTRLAYKRFFVRFDVTVAGGRPWRVKVVGYASEWEPGNAMPTELKGPAKPPWLDGRVDALTLAIYKKIKPYAVPVRDEVVETKPEDTLPKTDPKAFGNVPAAAAQRLAELRDAVVLRASDRLRAQLWDDLEWSLGGDPNADTALAMWQADPETLDAMVKAIDGGCAGTAQKVTCPAGDRVPGAWQLVLEQRGDAWKVSSFIRAE